MITENSRNTLTSVVRVLTPTGRLLKPEFVDLRQRVSGLASDDRTVVVDDSMSWASLALDRLADGTFWWSIADLSNVVDPFDELAEGQKLLVPSVQRMLFTILSTENQL